MATERECIEALDRFEDDLGRLSNVVGLGIVKPRDVKSGKFRAVAVYVKKKLPKTELKADDIVPKHLEIERGGRKTKVRTTVIEQGEVSLEKNELDRL